MTFVPANEGIEKVKPYQPGKPISELERELGITDIVKLASNENPLGCSDKVKQAVAAEIDEIGRYPDGGGFILTVVLGIVGAVVGGYISTFFGYGKVDGFNFGSFVVAVIGAIVVLFVYRKISS